MPVLNKFYSCKFNRPETIKGHRTRSAAIKGAGDYGCFVNTESTMVCQVHKTSDGYLKAFSELTPQCEEMDFDLITEVRKQVGSK